MADSLHELAEAGQSGSSYRARRPIKPQNQWPLEMVVLVGMGALVVIFVLYAMFKPVGGPETPPAPAANQAAPAGSSSAGVPAARPAAPARTTPWTVEEAIQLKARYLADGRLVISATNIAPRAVLEVEVAISNVKHIIIPKVPASGKIDHTVGLEDFSSADNAVPPVSLVGAAFEGVSRQP